MCFSSEVSLFTFILGLACSVMLMYHGNPKYNLENKSLGAGLIFIAFIQFMDFLFWIDLRNKWGINKLTTILGPILNVGMPTIFYLLKLYYYKPNLLRFDETNASILVANICYFIYFVINYRKFLTAETLKTSVEKCHLKWPWIKYFNPYAYIIMLSVNIIYLSDLKYASAFLMFLYLFLALSCLFFNYHSGEMWCFFGSFMPLIIYYFSFYL